MDGRDKKTPEVGVITYNDPGGRYAPLFASLSLFFSSSSSSSFSVPLLHSKVHVAQKKGPSDRVHPS